MKAKALVAVSALTLVVGGAAFADLPSQELQRDLQQLVQQTENLKNQTLQGPAQGAALESYALWGSALAFQQTVATTYHYDVRLVERALDLVDQQARRTGLEVGREAPHLGPQVYGVQQVLAEVRRDLYPVAAPQIFIQKCERAGNFLTPDLRVAGSVRGTDVRQLNVYMRGVLVGNPPQIPAPGANPRVELTTLFAWKFDKGASVGNPNLPAVCRFEAIDGRGRVAVQEVPLR